MEFEQKATEAIAELRSIRDMLRWSVSCMSEADVYFGHGTDNPWDEAVILVTHALQLPLHTESDWYASRVTDSERRAIVDVIRQRVVEQLPAPYITGIAWFCGLPFHVNRDVLIPRSPIAELIQQKFATQFIEAEHLLAELPNPRILDLCSGSGCIGIAIAAAIEHASVECLDISFEAQQVAEDNIAMHQLQDRVMALQSDLFSAAVGKYDLIVANPPYVDADDMSCLPLEYQHEPELALASGDDGLDLPRKILQQAAPYLTNEGVLILEVGNSWPALRDAYPQLALNWIEFEYGGHGVAAINAEHLRRAEL